MWIRKTKLKELERDMVRLQEAIHHNRDEYRARLKKLECKHLFTSLDLTSYGYYNEVCKNCGKKLAELTVTEYLEKEVERLSKKLEHNEAELKRRKEREAEILKGGT